MKRYIILIIIIANIAIVPANAWNLKEAFGSLAKGIAVAAGAAVVEQTCEHAGYSKEESQKFTRDLLNDLGANTTNVERGLKYVEASDKYEKQNVIKDFGLDFVGDVSGQSQMVESIRTMADASLGYLHDKTTATSDEEQQIAFDKRTKAYADVFYDSYQYGKQKRAKHLAEELQMKQKLIAQGLDPRIANDLAGSLIAVQKSEDWSQEEKEKYFNGLGLDLDSNIIATVALRNDEFYNEEDLKQQEAEARKIKEEENRKKEEDRKRKEAEARRVALEELDNVSIPTYSFDEVNLVAEQKQQLDTVAEILNMYKDVQISIIGHTCKIGYKSINLKKGLKRAEQCKLYLVEKGIEETRIITDSKGELSPKYNNSTFAGRAQNRRVEISIIETSSLE